jgi:hypothetical protein
MKLLTCVFSLVLIGVTSVTGKAAILFQDNFDDTPVGLSVFGTLPGGAFGGGWNITNNVDVLAAGQFGLPNVGVRYLDLAGSTAPAFATIQTQNSWGASLPMTVKKLSFSLAGDNRGNGDSVVQVKFGDSFTQNFNVASNSPFSMRTVDIDGAFSGKLSFQLLSQSGNNPFFGALLDNVKLEGDLPPNVIPEPVSLACMSLVVVGIGFSHLRRKKTS